jgi:uncharacterized integral membrane protein
MKLFKVIFTLVILGLIALFVWQNMETWLATVNFRLNLYFKEIGFSLQLYIVMFISALIGVFIGCLAMFKPYFKARRLLAQERQAKKQEQEPVAVKETTVEAVQS